MEILAARILLIDEQELDPEHLGTLLKEDGFDVERAPSVLHALDRLARETFDAVIIGGPSSGMSADAMLLALRATYSITELPVVIVFGGDTSEPMVRALEHGASDVLSWTGGYDLAVARLRHQVQRNRRHLELRDPDSGLAAFELFRDRVDNALSASLRDHSLAAILLVDLDPESTAGHDNRLSRAIASVLRGRDLATRLTTCRYAVLTEDVRAPRNALRVGQRISAALSEHEVDARIGIVAALPEYPSSSPLLEAATRTAEGLEYGAIALADEAMHDKAVSRLDLERDLHAAVEGEEFLVYYQPIVHIQTGTLAGFEALARWEHPTRGLMPPTLFIPVGEDRGLISEIGRQVLRQACERTAEWQQEHPGLIVAVNVSGLQLRPGIVGHVVDAVEHSGLTPATLRLELTESVIMDDFDAACRIFDRLAEAGVRLAIDDFGTGFSSLSYVHRLPAHTLKIDKSFVRRIEGPRCGPGLVDTIVQIAHGMGMDAVAEGIETQAQLDHLRAVGCDYAQGYLLAAPLDEVAAAAVLAEAKARSGRLFDL